MKIASLILMAFVCCQLADGLRILGVAPSNGKSHWIMMEKLMTTLAKRGHRVDVITQYPLQKPIPNYTDILVHWDFVELVNNMDAQTITNFDIWSMRESFQEMGNITCNMMGLPQLQELIKNPPKDPPYDLVIMEIFLAPCFLAFGRHLNVPIIGVVTTDLFDWLRIPTGNPGNPSYIPSMFSDFVQPMDFWDRLSNVLLSHIVDLQVYWSTEIQASHVKEHFGIEASVSDLYKDLALVLTNSHHSLSGIKPITQGIIEVGGLHVSEESDPLSPELQKWLDESKDGCLYFTMGSMARIETFPKSFIEELYKTFEKIAPVRVVMKVAKKEDLLPGLPKNVMIGPWFPQVSVFKHKNTKAFISHGGLMGTLEAIHFGIPMIGIPLFGDQFLNMKSVVSKKAAVSLGSFTNVTEETLTSAINAILYDDTYRSNMKKLSELFKDRPMSALDTAVYWVEYVGRHGDVLRSPAIHLTWWELYLLDVYGFLLACVAAVVYILLVSLRELKKGIFGKSNGRRNKWGKKKNK